MSDPYAAYLNAAHELANARSGYARAFQLAKAQATPDKPITDQHAHQIAVEMTHSLITQLEAALQVEEWKITKEIAK